MKLKRFIWAGTAAYLSYQLVKNRQIIVQEAKETKALSDEVQGHLKKIQEQIATITHQVPQLADTAKELSYKAQAFQGEVKARTEQMPLLQKETH